MTPPDDAPAPDRLFSRRFLIGCALMLIITPPAAWTAKGTLQGMFNAPVTWVPEQLEAKRTWNAFVHDFGFTDVILISWDGCTIDDANVPRAVEALRPLAAPRADGDPWIGDVSSGPGMLDALTGPPLRLSRRVAVARLRGSLIGEDGATTCLLVNVTLAGNRHRQELIAELRRRVSEAAGVSEGAIHLVGPPVEGALIDRVSQTTIDRYSLPSALLAAAICWYCLRSLLLSTTILLVALVGEALVLAAVGFSGTEMNAILIVLPPLVFVLTVSAGIHLANYYLDAIAAPERSPIAAASEAMRVGWKPCWLAAGTTVVGLLSLALVRISPVQTFGIVASLGLLAALGLLTLVLPGAMRLDGFHRRRRPPARGQGRGISWTDYAATPVIRYPWATMGVFIVATVALAAGLPRMRTTVNVPRMFPPESEIRQQYRWFEQHLGPTVTADVLVEFPDEVLRDPLDRLVLTQRLHAALLELPECDGVLSTATFLPGLPRAGGIGATARRSVVRRAIEQRTAELHELGFVALGPRHQRWRINLRFPYAERLSYDDLLRDAEGVVAPLLEEADPRLRATFTGSIAVAEAAQDALLRDLFRSFLAAFVVVAVVMVVLLRSLLGGLLAMVPNLFPTLTLFGSMGWAGMPLDIGSVMTASVALGIAVDGTLHLLVRFRRQRAFGRPPARSTRDALRQCGPAMVQTTLVCGLSLLVYGLSDFLPTRNFVVMMLALLLAALAGDLMFLPAMTSSRLERWLRPRRKRPEA